MEEDISDINKHIDGNVKSSGKGKVIRGLPTRSSHTTGSVHLLCCYFGGLILSITSLAGYIGRCFPWSW